jgi:hypothetical protein
MAKRLPRTLRTEETGYFVVYDRRTGQVLAVHHVTALPGVRVPSDDAIARRMRACAAEAIGRRAAELAILRTPEAPAVSPALRVDIATGKLRSDRREDRVTTDQPEGETSPAAPTSP